MIPVLITPEGVLLTNQDKPTPEVGVERTSFEDLCRVAAEEARKASTKKEI